MLIRDILNLKGGSIFEAAPDATLQDAVELMVRHDVGSLIVLDRGALRGMLTFREVLKALQSAAGSIGALKVRDVMVPDPLCGRPDQTIDELREMMTQHHVRYLPVVDAGTLLGIVSFHDVARAVIKETSMENRLLRRYIESQPSDRTH